MSLEAVLRNKAIQLTLQNCFPTHENDRSSFITTVIDCLARKVPQSSLLYSPRLKGGGLVRDPQHFQICKKVGQKSTMLLNKS